MPAISGFTHSFGVCLVRLDNPIVSAHSSGLQQEHVRLWYNQRAHALSHVSHFTQGLQLLSWQEPLLESLAMALKRGWMALLVGGPGSGKTRLARLAARLAGRRLTELALTPGTDTSDLLGRCV